MNKFGIITGRGYSFTYQIGEGPIASIARPGGVSDPERSAILSAQKLGSFYFWPAGENNDDPDICSDLISGNRLLPSLIEKQVSILYGTGPTLFMEEIQEDGTVKRRYLKDPEIQAWLESWQINGLQDSYKEYLRKAIRSYYYSEGIYSQWHLAKNLLADARAKMPVVGLEHIGELRCRLATTTDISRKNDVTNRDFNRVMVGNWRKGGQEREFAVFRRFDPANPTAVSGAISYSKNANYETDIYATNVFFKGIKSWIRGSNATADYINSFLENSLSARHHIIIPEAWFTAKKEALQDLCDMNARKKAEGASDDELIKITVGEETMEVGTEYSDALLDKYTHLELTNLTNFLAGRGKNQGKTYATRSFINGNGDVEKWEIDEIPQKYKEYIEALITYDKRADMVLLSAKGIDPSISNITSDGTISKSGADAYYNYIIYLTQQSIPEDVVCCDLNRAIAINFPDKYAQGIRIGFHRPTVQRQEDITPSNRLGNSNP